MAVAAYPYVEVKVVPPPPPVVQRAPGVVAVVGKTPDGDGGGTATPNHPERVDTLDDAATLFAQRDGDGAVVATTLYKSLVLAMLQDPRPSKIYGVRVQGDDYAAALAGLEAADDVTMVSLANEVDVGTADPPTGLLALKAHVETMSAGGQRQIGFAMVDPATAKNTTYVADVLATSEPLKSSTNRMVLLAARGANGDIATAGMAAVASLPPHYSVVLKKINGVTMPIPQQYAPGEIAKLAEAKVIPIIDPALIAGESLHFGDGYLFGADNQWIDLVRTLDDIEFRLRAGLIGLVGDARITKPGMTLLRTQVDGILGVLQRAAVIDDYLISIPVLDVLSIPEPARTATDSAILKTARENRTVDLVTTIFYGPAVSKLVLTLVAKF
ncbi:hypothetical protein OM076_11305 [Solirubrobacter ginsenosidimutans]|uniref:Tail sheath protein subtilisin-like domain-containing protein n=1 Tax=Solirubrobacter ginsenosidimutans TaxID=490573 RepID=A0A9X3MVS0_9ACTN|nr:hypothetical protein [Solirubrobacter ginsenosidimutans]MDA0160853.1 hypothetical protein [Solirubrobacter ginsenosidimutans]